jgi:hypothetical protein
MANKKFDELTDRDLFASLIFLGFVLRAGHITDMTGEAITAVYFRYVTEMWQCPTRFPKLQG